LFVSVVIALRLEAYQFGLILTQYELGALREALAFHGLGAIAMLLLLVVSRAAKSSRPIAAKMALASAPLVLLASVDRLAAIMYEPLHPEAGLFMTHPTRGWTCRPGWVGRDEAATIRINSQGLRCPEIPLAKPDHERRILFLGDSVTFGSNVDENASFVSLVQQHFGQVGSERRITTINASVPAYSPCHELDLLEEVGLRYHPDLIVHVFCLNDVLGRFQLERFGGCSRGFAPPIRSRLEWSGLARAARAWRAAATRPTEDELMRIRATYSPRRVLYEPESSDVQRGWRMTLDNMEQIVAAARHASVPLAIAFTPHRDQLSLQNEGAVHPQAVLAAFADRHGIPFLDLVPVFREYVAGSASPPTALYVDRLHFSAAGHRLAAEAIHRFLIVQGFSD
jgi:lysophospholipase L1-like esterase